MSHEITVISMRVVRDQRVPSPILPTNLEGSLEIRGRFWYEHNGVRSPISSFPAAEGASISCAQGAEVPVNLTIGTAANTRNLVAFARVREFDPTVSALGEDDTGIGQAPFTMVSDIDSEATVTVLLSQDVATEAMGRVEVTFRARQLPLG